MFTFVNTIDKKGINICRSDDTCFVAIDYGVSVIFHQQFD